MPVEEAGEGTLPGDITMACRGGDGSQGETGPVGRRMTGVENFKGDGMDYMQAQRSWCRKCFPSED